MKKYEYKVLLPHEYAGPVIYAMNNLGKDGWELVSVCNSGEAVLSLYFKREITDK